MKLTPFELELCIAIRYLLKALQGPMSECKTAIKRCQDLLARAKQSEQRHVFDQLDKLDAELDE